MNTKQKSVLDRIKHLEEAIAKGREFLASGAHAHWHGFRPVSAGKVKDDKPLPPNRNWVQNVFLPRNERALRRAEKVLANLE